MHAVIGLNHNSLIGIGIAHSNRPRLYHAIAYIPGMITHALDCSLKIFNTIVFFIFAIGFSIALIFNSKNEPLKKLTKEFWILTADALFTVGIDLVGVLIPPLAYRIEKYLIQNFILNNFKDYKNPFSTNN